MSGALPTDRSRIESAIAVGDSPDCSRRHRRPCRRLLRPCRRQPRPCRRPPDRVGDRATRVGVVSATAPTVSATPNLCRRPGSRRIPTAVGARRDRVAPSLRPRSHHGGRRVGGDCARACGSDGAAHTKQALQLRPALADRPLHVHPEHQPLLCMSQPLSAAGAPAVGSDTPSAMRATAVGGSARPKIGSRQPGDCRNAPPTVSEHRRDTVGTPLRQGRNSLRQGRGGFPTHREPRVAEGGFFA